MAAIEKKIYYFEKPGKENTDDCLKFSLDAVTQMDIRDVVVATTGGDTGLIYSEAFNGKSINLVAVTHSHGFKEANTFEMPPDIASKIKQNGAILYTGTMVTHSLESAFSQKFNGLYPTLIVAQSLRRFGEGTKVCCEIVMMATDAGLITEGADVLAVAGTGRGADTVLVIRSAASKRFFDLKILEIIAKPRL
ncbi:pyruvate kinase alpha/beta domain-containing protein [Candidatus Magnetomonas plexicatena]|uniref:pyruvate kinase alpha/beta domain-containing protein n=1 Tax=Candidatus Magnetomonas plexicatena TaxID=2552947 RepID=UPI001C7679EE|nr:hypothetical protein E2O03_009540 [Nitrospirales bacterium LBB_01]